MKIVIAPASFKEALKAREAAAAVAEGVRAASPDCEIVLVPMADGGEGTCEILVEAAGGCYKEAAAAGPLGEPVATRYGLIDGGNTAVVEMAAASGLALVPRRLRDPMKTTTKGTGELIRAALGEGARKIIVAIGGSATVDGGCGMAAALGVVMTDAGGSPAGLCGGDVGRIARIDLGAIDRRVADTEIIVACDVDNPLLGEDGAARSYGPQKGATAEQVEILEKGLEHLADLLEAARLRRRPLRNIPGAGAAGGLGLGLAGFLGATLHRGFEIVAGAVGLVDAMRGADLVVTGEGSIDGQSAHGKVVCGVGRLARSMGIPAVALAGRVELSGKDRAALGLDRVILITPADTPREPALAACGINLKHAAQRLIIELEHEQSS